MATYLQERIMDLVKKGRSMRQIVSVTKASATYVRRFMKRARTQTPVRAEAAKTFGRVHGVAGTVGTHGLTGVTTNGHLSVEAIEAKANEHLEKAGELRRAAEALRGEGLIS